MVSSAQAGAPWSREHALGAADRLFRMPAFGEQGLDERERLGADGRRPLQDLWVGIGAVMRRHVRRIGDEALTRRCAAMQCNPLIADQHFDMRLGQADLDDLSECKQEAAYDQNRNWCMLKEFEHRHANLRSATCVRPTGVRPKRWSVACCLLQVPVFIMAGLGKFLEIRG